jgi:N-acetyl sugar amidotransferase
MDTTVSNVVILDDGNCNLCSDFLERYNALDNTTKAGKSNLDNFIQKIKNDGKRKKYDCIVGVSGGVDSSWALVKAVEMGLKPLAVHMDNGWNSELAQNNITNLLDKLNVDLYTHVIEWEEYKKLMQAFFDASVIDVELLYDNAMLAVNYNLAKEIGVKYILSGSNQATEGIRTPVGWNWFKKDKANIYDIAKKHGNVKIKSFPSIGTLGFIYNTYVKGIQWVPFLDYFDFSKDSALNVLVSDYGYKPYPYKHYESVFTRFYQGYILPNKFNVDKRLLHLSVLVASGQMEKKKALEILQTSPYPSEKELVEDTNYFLKKMEWSQEDLDIYMHSEIRQHSDYRSEKSLWDTLKNIYFKFR